MGRGEYAGYFSNALRLANIASETVHFSVYLSRDPNASDEILLLRRQGMARGPT